MSFHLFGNFLSCYGAAANNRGENEGNIRVSEKMRGRGAIVVVLFPLTSSPL